MWRDPSAGRGYCGLHHPPGGASGSQWASPGAEAHDWPTTSRTQMNCIYEVVKTTIILELFSSVFEFIAVLIISL